jgi:hypothetical protein
MILNGVAAATVAPRWPVAHRSPAYFEAIQKPDGFDAKLYAVDRHIDSRRIHVRCAGQ